MPLSARFACLHSCVCVWAGGTTKNRRQQNKHKKKSIRSIESNCGTHTAHSAMNARMRIYCVPQVNKMYTKSIFMLQYLYVWWALHLPLLLARRQKIKMRIAFCFCPKFLSLCSFVVKPLDFCCCSAHEHTVLQWQCNGVFALFLRSLMQKVEGGPKIRNHITALVPNCNEKEKL